MFLIPVRFWNICVESLVLSLISLMPTMIKDLRMTLDGGTLISPSSKFYCIKSDVSYGVCCMAAVEFAVFCVSSLWMGSLLFVGRGTNPCHWL